MYPVYRNKAAAAFLSLYSVFFLSNFQTLKIFVTLFSGTVRPRSLRLGAHMDNGWIYGVYRNQAAAAYLSFCFFIFLFVQFSNIKIFRYTFLRRGQKNLNLVHLLIMDGCIVSIRMGLLPLICPFISSFFFLSNYQTLTIFVTSQELWGLESWNLVHMWTVDTCIIQELGCCCLFVCLLVHFSFSPIFSYKFVFLLW